MASVVAAVIAGGTMSAFVAASRMQQGQGPAMSTEVSNYAQQTLERFRNLIACDSPWFDPVTCAPTAGVPTAWTEDPLPPPDQTAERSIVRTTAKRCYRVVPQDCDGDTVPTDCFSVEVQVCWNGETCSC